MKSALTAISTELDAIRASGTWHDGRIITTPQHSRFDTTVKNGVVNFCANNDLDLSANQKLIMPQKPAMINGASICCPVSIPSCLSCSMTPELFVNSPVGC